MSDEYKGDDFLGTLVRVNSDRGMDLLAYLQSVRGDCAIVRYEDPVGQGIVSERDLDPAEGLTAETIDVVDYLGTDQVWLTEGHLWDRGSRLDVAIVKRAERRAREVELRAEEQRAAAERSRIEKIREELRTGKRKSAFPELDASRRMR